MRNDAITDILQNPRFEGAIESIRGLTEFLDNTTITFISVVAFFIISAALLRNVIAGAYAAYPKGWDKVAEAKEAMRNKKTNIGGQDVSILFKLIAFMIPDLKSISDFSDDTVEPKHYFIKAIPQMILVVFIGVFIYNGYYRDAVVKTSQFGSVIIDKVLLNTNPEEMVTKVFSSLTTGSFASEQDATSLGKLTYKVSKEAYSQVITHYYDVEDKGSKNKIAQGIESHVYAFLSDKSEYLNEERYSAKYQVDMWLGEPDLSRITASNGLDETYTTFATSLRVRGMGFDSLLHSGEEWYVRMIVRFEKKVEKVKDTGIYQDLILTVSEQQCVRSNGLISSIQLKGSTRFYKNGSDVYTYDPASGKLVFVKATPADSGVILLSPKLAYTTSDGKQHSIAEIRIVSGDTSFTQTLQSKSRPEISTNVGGDFSTQ